MHQTNLSVREFITEIESQSEFKFIYADGVHELLEQKFKVSPKATVQHHLKTAETFTPFEFKITGENILIRKSIKKQVSIPITGLVLDEDNQPLVGATVLIKGSTTGVVTGIDGTYTIDVPNGQAVLVFSYIGFDPQEIVVQNQS
ncbi:MAG: carboxypeptidase-like regulatory domain-containing protein, partial [Flavobacteriales bacterium]